MARRRSPKRRVRRNRNFKILKAAEAFAQANIVTESLMSTNALEFALGDLGVGFSSGGGISLKELITQPRLIGVVGQRASNPEILLGIAVKSAVTNFGFRFASKALSRPIRMMNNNVLKPLALGVQL
jgi:hypothetical protein